ALEGEEDDEPEQDGKARSEHAEDAGRTIAVLEVAAVGRPTADEQHGGDGNRGHHGDDQRRPEEVHPAGPCAAGGNSISARRAVSGVSGTVIRPRVGRSRSKITSRSSVTSAPARTTVVAPRPCNAV